MSVVPNGPAPRRAPSSADRDPDSVNLAERLAWIASENGWWDRTAYVADGAAYRYSEAHEGADRAAAVLADRGLARQSRLLIVLPDGIELIWAFLGTMRLGAVPVLANSDLHADELRRAAELSAPDAVMCEADLAELFTTPIVAPDDLRLTGFPVPKAADCDAATPGFALFTSGTTSDPRLCFHAHGDPLVFQRAFGQVLDLTAQDVCYSVSRMYFSYGLGNSLFYPLMRGSTTVLTAERPSPDTAIDLIEEHGITVFYAQPSFYGQLLSRCGPDELAGLRLAMCAGEVIPGFVETRLQELTGNRMLNVLGTTEVGQVFASNTPGHANTGTVGPALPPYQMRVVDDDGNVVSPGVEGNLQVAGPTIAPGVARGGDPPVHGIEEWWATGDAATMDSAGIVQVHGRADDIEIVGGANVHPTEIEDTLLQHPLVLHAAVCSVRDGVGASRLRAYVVLHDTDADDLALSGELLATAKEKLTWYKIPEEVRFVAELPRTTTGKLHRRKLRAIAAGDG